MNNAVFLPALQEHPERLSEALSGSLRNFVTVAYGHVEPNKLQWGWHIDAITEHLEAVSDGEISQLIINCPPRHMKSLLVSVFWPAWEWTKSPEEQYLAATYAQSLTVRDSLKMRRLVTSDWYSTLWPHIELRKDQWAKTYFENTKGGSRKSVSVGSQVTGFGGTRKIIDDPHNALDMSDTKRQEVLDWYSQAFATRENDPGKMATVLIMQRLHEEDLAGYLMERGTWEELILPAEYEGMNRIHTSLDWEDKRNHEGEILWPSRFGRDTLDRWQVELGPSGASGQLQQRPTAKGGGEFLEKWWQEGRNRYDPTSVKVRDSIIARWLSFDTAMKDKSQNDYSAMTVWELTNEYKLIMRKAWHERLQFPLLVNRIETEAVRWNRDDKLHGVIIEDKGSGTSAIQTLSGRLHPDLANLLIGFQPSGNKETRARQAAVWCERDCILLPVMGNGVFDLEQELYKFPNAKHDDLLDTMTQAIIYLEEYLSIGYQWRAGYLKLGHEETEDGLKQLI